MLYCRPSPTYRDGLSPIRAMFRCSECVGSFDSEAGIRKHYALKHGTHFHRDRPASPIAEPELAGIVHRYRLGQANSKKRREIRKRLQESAGAGVAAPRCCAMSAGRRPAGDETSEDGEFDFATGSVNWPDRWPSDTEGGLEMDTLVSAMEAAPSAAVGRRRSNDSAGAVAENRVLDRSETAIVDARGGHTGDSGGL